MQKKLAIFVVLFFGFLPAQQAQASPRSNPLPPLTLSLTGPVKPALGHDVVLSLEISRPMPSEVPILLKFEVPDGAVLVGSAPEERIIDEKSTIIVRNIRLRIYRVPVRDLVVSADVRTSIHGVHATATYRFGRPEPVLPKPELGPEIKLRNGVSFGRPIMLQGK